MMHKNKTLLNKLTKYLRVFPLVFMLLTAKSVYSQDPIKKEGKGNEVVEELPHIVIKYPEFPGGATGLMKYLGDNIKYPVEAQKNKIEGRVLVNFMVNKDGSVSDINIEHSQNPLLDAEAIRVISIMPKWRPAIQMGRAVNCGFSLPITFSLPESGNNEEFSDFDNDEDEVFVLVDKEPEYPGGPSALVKFLGHNVKYPVKAIRNHIQGRIVVNFIVHKDGSMSDINVTEKTDPMLDAEAIRVVSTMPNWIPGEQNGKVVNTRFFLPVIFRLESATP